MEGAVIGGRRRAVYTNVYAILRGNCLYHESGAEFVYQQEERIAEKGECMHGYDREWREVGVRGGCHCLPHHTSPLTCHFPRPTPREPTLLPRLAAAAAPLAAP